eukprot:COSAG02_NODE_744_length_17752_cov_56.794992_3_plen_467_part_00
MLPLLLLAMSVGLVAQNPSHACSDTMLNAKTQFGAVGDGITDDSAHLQAAIDAAVGCGGKALFLPVGTYMLTRALRVTGHMQMLGEGASGSCHGLDTNVSAGNMRGTVLLQTNSSADGLYVSVGSHCESVQLRDFSLVARPTHSAGAAVRVVGIENNMCDGKFERLLMENWQTGVHCLACQNAALNDLKIRRPWSHGVIIEGDPHISWDQDAAGDSRIAGLDFFGCQRNGAGGGHDGCHSHAAIEYRNGGSWFISQGKYLLGDYGVLLNQTRGPTGTLLITGNSFEEQIFSSVAFILGKPENLTCKSRVLITANIKLLGGSWNFDFIPMQFDIVANVCVISVDSSYANVVVSNNEMSNLNDNHGAHIIVQRPNFTKTKEPDPTWMRNLVITGNVVNSAVNATTPLFHITSTEGAVIANNVINNNGCHGPSAILVDNETVTGLKCRNNVAQISGVEDLTCFPAECCY